MKKILMPLAALAVLATSCGESKDSYYTVPYTVYNLIVDLDNDSEPAQVSDAVYSIKHNISKDVIDLTASSLSINNQKVSFETDTMSYSVNRYKVDDKYTVEELVFGGRDVKTSGATVDYLNAKLNWRYVPGTSNLLNPDFEVVVVQNLDMSYRLNDRFSVKTFNSDNYYMGNTYVSIPGGDVLSTKETNYMVRIDFVKKEAMAIVYNPEFVVSDDAKAPKLISIEGIKLVFNHDKYYLEADEPTTKVLVADENGNTQHKEDSNYKVTDFLLTVTSSDMADAAVSYKLGDKTVSFSGTSIMKPGIN